MNNRVKLIERIKALQARTMENGCTESEAMTAANLCARLMAEHDLTMTDVEIGEEICQVNYLDTGRKSNHEVQFCISAIADFCDTKVWISKRNGTQNYCFFGMANDTDFAKFLHNTIKGAMETELTSYKIRCVELGELTGRRQSHSFLLGMALRICERLREMKQENQRDILQTTGRDLVVVKNSVVKSQFAKLGLRLRNTGNGTTSGDSNSMAAGKAAGNRVGFNRPIGGNSSGYYIGN